MIRKGKAAGLAVAISLALSSCSYQGWTRYECQEFENWEKAECNPPQCKATGVCTEDIFGENLNGLTSSKPSDQ